MSALERVLAYLNLIAELGLLWRLLHFHLNRTYRPLFIYWLVQAVANVAILSAPMATYLYLYLYWGAQTINIFTAVFVVQDLYRIALADHPAVASFGRRSMLGALALAGLLALSGASLDTAILPGQYTAIHRFATFERSMNFVVLVYLLLISGLLLWFPIKVRRNIVVYIFGFVLFSGSRSFGLLLANLLPAKDTRLISTVLLGLTLLCLLIWIVGIRPEGEHVTATPGSRRNPETARRLTGQLDAINSALSRFGRS
jgi:hypothetical protein